MTYSSFRFQFKFQYGAKRLPCQIDTKDLIVWQRAIDLVEKIYPLTQRFPREELYGLTSQLRRASKLKLKLKRNYFFPSLSCCFQPSTRALFPSASASGTMPFL
jgi:hypothetical protein